MMTVVGVLTAVPACTAQPIAARIVRPEQWREAKKAVSGCSSNVMLPTPAIPSFCQSDNNGFAIYMIDLCIYVNQSLLSCASDNKLA